MVRALLRVGEITAMVKANTKPRSVLVVDDDEGLTRAIANLLRLEGYDVATALNGIQGYAAYFRNPTEFVLTDIQMPEWDGLEMIRAIRALNPEVKAVYTSGAVESYRAEIDCEPGAKAMFLEKPFTRSELLGVLSHASNNSESRAETV